MSKPLEGGQGRSPESIVGMSPLRLARLRNYLRCLKKNQPCRAGWFGMCMWGHDGRNPQSYSRPGAKVLYRLENEGMAKRKRSLDWILWRLTPKGEKEIEEVPLTPSDREVLQKAGPLTVYCPRRGKYRAVQIEPTSGEWVESDPMTFKVRNVIERLLNEAARPARRKR